MGTNVTAQVTGYNIRIEQNSPYESERVVYVVAVLSDSNGNEIGTVDTDVFEFSKNLPLALLKAYQINRKLANGSLVPEADL